MESKTRFLHVVPQPLHSACPVRLQKTIVGDERKKVRGLNTDVPCGSVQGDRQKCSSRNLYGKTVIYQGSSLPESPDSNQERK
ncbi:Hypothetical predicted protein [Marmota monax]|uniref:Uncharacterized protein n=1 Tax=Marmota monax TaxID=9995 RepID=A0A5E4CX25_MARMO|nr:Hypothetical predicted protein [Marmota monax]